MTTLLLAWYACGWVALSYWARRFGYVTLGMVVGCLIGGSIVLWCFAAAELADCRFWRRTVWAAEKTREDKWKS